MLSVLCMHLCASPSIPHVQVQGSPGYPILYSGPLDCVRKIAATEGLRGFYRSGLVRMPRLQQSVLQLPSRGGLQPHQCRDAAGSSRQPGLTGAWLQGRDQQLPEGGAVHCVRALPVRGAHPGLGNGRHSPVPNAGAGLDGESIASCPTQAVHPALCSF